MNNSWPKTPYFLSSVIAKQVQLQSQRIFISFPILFLFFFTVHFLDYFFRSFLDLSLENCPFFCNHKKDCVQKNTNIYEQFLFHFFLSNPKIGWKELKQPSLFRYVILVKQKRGITVNRLHIWSQSMRKSTVRNCQP